MKAQKSGFLCVILHVNMFGLFETDLYCLLLLVYSPLPREQLMKNEQVLERTSWWAYNGVCHFGVNALRCGCFRVWILKDRSYVTMH